MELTAMISQAQLDFESEPWPKISKSAVDLVKRMLDLNPKKRPSAMSILDHPWFKQKNAFKIPILTL